MKKLLKIFGLLLITENSYAQTILNTTVTEANKVVTDPVSVNFLSGFNANAANINSFSAYITSGSGSGSTGLSAGENYIYTKNCLNEDCSKNSESVQYSDGLGRSKQTIAIKASPSGKDIVIPIEYDAFGRQLKSYLPIPQTGTQNGALYANPKSNASQTYGSDLYFYSESVVENSPVGKPLFQTKPGMDYQGHSIGYNYEVNTSGEVKKYTVATSWVNGATENAISLSGNYNAGELIKTSVTDEDGNKTTEFKNGKGQTILARKKVSSTENADTYYVYNKYGQLVYVLPPLVVSATLNQTTLDNLAYQYKYDSKSRLVEKKLPGKGWEYMVYDKQNRLTLTQDANLRSLGQWMFIKYDKFSRPVYTGILDSYATRIAQANVMESMGASNESRSGSAVFTVSGVTLYYTKNAYPTANMSKILSVNYYDTYPPLPSGVSIPVQVLGQATITDNLGSSINTKNLPTASYVKNVEDDNWTKNYIWYDAKGRTVGSHTINHLGGYTKTESLLDFAGVTQQSKVYHKRSETDAERIITQTFEYDTQNRLKKHWHQVDSQAQELLSENTYNELSQLVNKKVGASAIPATGGISAPLQSMDYTYNIRGALTKINNPSSLNGKLFGYEVKYNNPVYTNIAPGKYNGNISEIDWNISTEGTLKRYTYSYDSQNRLKDAIYTEPNSTVPFNNNYNENLTYDLNGNIKTLKRNAFPVAGTTSTLVDDLVYQYTGNRLDKIIENSLNDTGYEGGSNTIDYDLNGNMLHMKDKGISSIGYNYLNLPDATAMTETTVGGIAVNYMVNNLYRADGAKLRKTVYKTGGKGVNPTTTYTDYLDGFQYTYEQGELTICADCISLANTALEREAYSEASRPVIPTWTLDFVPTSEGFYSFRENRYIYQYKDHLGNTRVSFAKNSAGVLEVTDANNYYPFGLNHIGGTNNGLLGSYYNYKYNGKEIQESGMYDYGARFYMPDIGRWGVIDPLAETSRRFNPYNYAYNNPVSFIDPDGRKAYAPDRWTWNTPTNGALGYMMGGGSATFGSFDEFLGQRNPFAGLGRNTTGGGGAGISSGSATTFGQTQAYFDLIAALQNGQNFGLFNNGNIMSWWTDAEGAQYGQYNILKMVRPSFWSDVVDFFKNHFVFELEGKGTLGVQGGFRTSFGTAEAGIMTGDIGKFGISTKKGLFAKYGDGKGHNFAGIGLGVKKVSAGIKADYVTNDIVPIAGDLLDYYPNNGRWDIEGNIGPRVNMGVPNGSLSPTIDSKIKQRFRTGTTEACLGCLDMSFGMKLILGIDIRIRTGFTGL